MRALHVPAVGERPRLSDLPVPEPGEGQVLIRVMAAALNGIAAGMMAEMIEHAYPLVLGRDAAAVDAVDPQPGRVVLVVGAADPAGSFAIQMLAASGATVLATGTAADTGRLKSLGAATVVDDTIAPVADEIRAAYPDGIDALIDLVACAPNDLPLAAVCRGGTVASSLRAASDQALSAAGLTGINIMVMPTREVSSLADLVMAGTLKVDVTDVLPLDRAADGLAALASGEARGTIVVQVGS
jgi:NADPH:quinone reductase-like Zn-dependent oxidoreductase